MAALVLDTHTIIWYLEGSTNLSANAIKAIDKAYNANEPIYIASITLVEVLYLVEKEKLPSVALSLLLSALGDSDSGFVIVTLDCDIAQAMSKIPSDVVPDMPDRIIAATAHYLGLPLVTCNNKIKAANIETIW